MTRKNKTPIVTVALPFAYQDGMDKYNGIMRYLREKGCDWELQIVRHMPTAAQFRERVERTAVNGVICGSFECFEGSRRDLSLPRACLEVCAKRGIPLVGLDWPIETLTFPAASAVSLLNIDSEKIGAYAARLVREAGNYASYGFVGLYPEVAWSRTRGAFFAKSLRKDGLGPVRLFKGDPQTDVAELTDWLRGLEKPAAIFASNDCAADIVLKSCSRTGLRVPEDMSVLGVDDDPVFCVHTRPTLSSIHPDFEKMGYLAARELDRLLSGRSRGRRIIVAGNPTATLRTSTAPSSPAGRLVRRVDEIIAARACQDIGSNVIADELKISRRLLDLRYRQMTGRSVHETIIDARLRRVKHLLAYSGHSIGTVCRLCGYRTESYLGRIFLAREGMTMSAYRTRNAP